MKDDDINYTDVYKWLNSLQKTHNERVKKQLQNLIVVACMPLVYKISCGLARRSTDPLDDLVQVGSVGLLKAVNSFNSERANNFKTYATHLITGEIRHYLRDKCAMIKAPREVQELAYRIYQISKTIEGETGEKPTDIEIAEYLQMDLGRVYEVIDVERRKTMVSLDQLNSITEEEQCPLYEKIPDTKSIENQNLKEVRIMLHEALLQLPEEDCKLIELHFFEDVPQRELSEMYNITQMKMSRKIKRSLNKLFKIIEKEDI